jgi:hypothetical protein
LELYKRTNKILSLINRDKELFHTDILNNDPVLCSIVSEAYFLVIGGAGSIEYDAFIKSDGKYDYVLNLSALKHVRSEEDPFTLMKMIDVNIFNTDKISGSPLVMAQKNIFV